MARQPSKPRPPHCWHFEIIFRHTTFVRTPLHYWSARSWDIYLRANNTQQRQTSLPPAGFEPSIPTIELPQTHALDRAATEISKLYNNKWNNDKNDGDINISCSVGRELRYVACLCGRRLPFWICRHAPAMTWSWCNNVAEVTDAT